MLETILMPLDQTGRQAFVPVTALWLSETLYEVLSFEEHPGDARWRFPGGSVVCCEQRLTGRMKVAVIVALALPASSRRAVPSSPCWKTRHGRRPHLRLVAKP